MFEGRSPEGLLQTLQKASYVADRSLAVVTFLALELERPLLLEGEAGVGKTELAKVLAEALGVRLIRLQCYEGLDLQSAVYEWDYARQLLHIRWSEGAERGRAIDTIYSEEFLLSRPLLEAIREGQDSGEQTDLLPPVLLIDELDRADEEFEAFLLELLSDFQITIPELGTIRAARRPIVIITSNRTREIHDALRRRCLYHWIDYPSLEKELEIIRLKVPTAGEVLSRQVAEFVRVLRNGDLYKPPGLAETLDWMRALTTLDAHQLSEQLVADTLGAVLKYRDDFERVKAEGFLTQFE